MMRLERFDSGSWRYQTCNACNACNVNDGFDCAGSWLRAYWEKVLNSLPTAYTHIPPSGVCLQFVDNRWHLDNQLRQLSFGCQTTRPFWLSINACICASCVTYFLLTKKRVWDTFSGESPTSDFGKSWNFFQQPNPACLGQIQLLPKIVMESSVYLLAIVWRRCWH